MYSNVGHVPAVHAQTNNYGVRCGEGPHHRMAAIAAIADAPMADAHMMPTFASKLCS